MRGSLLDILEDRFIEARHDDLGRGADDGFRLENFEVFRLPVGLEEYGLQIDVTGIGIEIYARFSGGFVDMARHAFERSREGGVLLGIMSEEREIFDGIPERAYAESEDEEGDEDNSPSTLIAKGEVEEEESGKRSEEEYRHLGSDGTKGMRKSFVSQEFRREHDEEDDEEECVPGEMRVVLFEAQAGNEESPGLSEEEKESGEEESADDGIEDRIWRVVVAEILIADEIIFDEGEAERFREGAEEIPMIHFG